MRDEDGRKMEPTSSIAKPSRALRSWPHYSSHLLNILSELPERGCLGEGDLDAYEDPLSFS